MKMMADDLLIDWVRMNFEGGGNDGTGPLV